MMSTYFWSLDGKPISAEEFLNNLFGELPNLFKSEDELRTLWSNPLTRRTLLEKLDCGYYDYQHLSKAYQKFTQQKPNDFHLLDMNAPERKFGGADTY